MRGLFYLQALLCIAGIGLQYITIGHTYCQDNGTVEV
nr:MAG TPA: hypothetical protein [Caudoviricetes sp.]